MDKKTADRVSTLIVTAIFVLIVPIAFYLVLSFTVLEINVFLWPAWVRGIFAVVTLVWEFVCFFIIWDLKQNKQL